MTIDYNYMFDIGKREKSKETVAKKLGSPHSRFKHLRTQHMPQSILRVFWSKPPNEVLPHWCWGPFWASRTGRNRWVTKLCRFMAVYLARCSFILARTMPGTSPYIKHHQSPSVTTGIMVYSIVSHNVACAPLYMCFLHIYRGDSG
jgi:hypothetical protein